jgi:tryptophan synthase alpha chain
MSTSRTGTRTDLGSGQDRLAELFARTRAEGRAALVGYLPAGYPDVATSRRLFAAMIEGGCDLVEVGLPFSDPVLDGPVIQAAAQTALAAGWHTRDVFDLVEGIAEAGGGTGLAVVMTYFNPVLAHGVDAFARDLAAAGGCGVITPDLIVDEAGEWTDAAGTHGLAPIFLVAPSSPTERIARTTAATRGFLYAASVMGVTGARDQVGSGAADLVARCRAVTDLPIGVGLGVRTAEQAAQIAGFADAVIVGSAFVSAAGPDGTDVEAVRRLAADLARGVRAGGRTGTTSA